MAKIIGVKEWSDVTLLEDGDVLHGGEDGLINAQAKALTDRTNWLRENMSMGSGGGEGASGGGLPIGSIIALAGKTVPFGFLECDGRALSRGAYIQLYEAIGTIWGSTSESDFKLPNLTEAERFLRSRSESLSVGTLQGDAIRNIKGDLGNVYIRTNVSSDQTGAFKKIAAESSTTWAAGNASSKNQVIFDASLSVPTADENRPKSAVVMYCIKVLDSVRDPEQVLAQAAIADMAHRNEIKELAGTRLWVSTEYQPVLNTPTIVTHGLNIDPLRCRCDVLLKCVVSQGGYNVGDYAIGWSGLNISGYHLSHPPVPSLTSTTIQFNTGAYSTGLVVYNKTNGGSLADFKVANWRYIFRIWY